MLNGLNGASIDADQGGLGDAWDNVWNPDGSLNLKVDGLLLGIPTGINWYHQGADLALNQFSTSPRQVNIIFPWPNQSSGNITCDDFSRYAVNRTANFGSIIGDSARYTTDSLETRYQGRLELYRAMLRDSTITYQSDSLDTVFETFFNFLDTGNVGRFTRVMELAEIDADSAAYLNSMIVPVGETESLLKAFYELYFDKIISGDTLSPADSSDLENLISLSRSAYGELVHNAAAALFYEIHPDESSSRFGTTVSDYTHTSYGISSVDDVRIYPNPANETITLLASYEMKNIEIFNTYGSLLITTQCNINVQQIDLSTLPSGIYYVKTLLLNGYMAATKLVLQK